MDDFDYFEPKSIAEAVSLLNKYQGKAKIIAGGTDLLVDIKGRKISPQYVVDLQSIDGLDYIRYDRAEGLRLGAMVTIRSIELSGEVRQAYPAVCQAAAEFTHVAIRNLATVGGNLCQAVPSADLAPPLIAYSAAVKICGPAGERITPLEEFFAGPGRTSLGADEVLVEIQVPPTPANMRGRNVRYSPRATGLPTVIVSVVASIDPKDKVCREIRIVLGNVAPTPFRARRAEEVVRGKRLDEPVIRQAAAVAYDEARPRPGSLRASAWYKKEMIMVFTRQALTEIAA